MQRELLNQTLVKFHHGGIIFSPLTHIYPYTTPTFVGFIPRIVVCSPPRSDSGSILKFCLKPAVLCVIHRWESQGLCQILVSTWTVHKIFITECRKVQFMFYHFFFYPIISSFLIFKVSAYGESHQSLSAFLGYGRVWIGFCNKLITNVILSSVR